MKSDKDRVRRVASNDPDLDTNAPRDKLLFLEKLHSTGKESKEDVSPVPTGYTANLALNANVDGSRRASPRKFDDSFSSRFPSPEMRLKAPSNSQIVAESTFVRSFSPVIYEGKAQPNVQMLPSPGDSFNRAFHIPLFEIRHNSACSSTQEEWSPELTARGGIPKIDVREYLEEGGAELRKNNKMLFPLNNPNYYFIHKEDLRTKTYEANIVKAGRSKIKVYAPKDAPSSEGSLQFFASKPLSS